MNRGIPYIDGRSLYDLEGKLIGASKDSIKSMVISGKSSIDEAITTMLSELRSLVENTRRRGICVAGLREYVDSSRKVEELIRELTGESGSYVMYRNVLDRINRYAIFDEETMHRLESVKQGNGKKRRYKKPRYEEFFRAIGLNDRQIARIVLDY
jgi:hypothetical protein